jgi:hypothetical protein
MKPFDLEKAKAGAPLVTRDGRAAKFVAYLPECDRGHRVIAVVNCTPWHYHENGEMFHNESNADDLFLADPPKVKKSRYFGILVEIKAPHYTQVVEGEGKHSALKGWNMEVWKLVSEYTHTWEEEAP